MNLAQFGKDALARYDARHAEADDIQYNSAGFWYDRASGLYLIEVRGHIVAGFTTMERVRAFCHQHNSRIA